MVKLYAVLILTCLLIAVGFGDDISSQERFTFKWPISLSSKVWAHDANDQTDLQWFKETMKISPKYQEQDHGLLGMSYTHFFVMVFLILFFIGTFINSYLRNKRTKDVLQTLLKEESNHDS